MRIKKENKIRKEATVFSSSSSLSSIPSHRQYYFFRSLLFIKHNMFPISSLTPSLAIQAFCSHLHGDCDGEEGCKKAAQPIST